MAGDMQQEGDRAAQQMWGLGLGCPWSFPRNQLGHGGGGETLFSITG